MFRSKSGLFGKVWCLNKLALESWEVWICLEFQFDQRQLVELLFFLLLDMDHVYLVKLSLQDSFFL